MEPTEAAVRGLESLPNGTTTREGFTAPNWGPAALEETPPSDAERVIGALEKLDHAREFHTPDRDLSTYGRRTPSEPDSVSTIDELCDALGYESPGPDVEVGFGPRGMDAAGRLEERLDELQKDEYHPRREREDILDRLDAIEESVDELTRPRARGGVVQFVFGSSRSEATARLTTAVDVVRDVLTEDDDEPAQWGMCPPEEGV